MHSDVESFLHDPFSALRCTPTDCHSLCHAARDHGLLVQACLGRAQFQGAQEVVLLQASNSYFAYEPILKALQQMTVLAMAKYLEPGLAGEGTDSWEAGEKPGKAGLLSGLQHLHARNVNHHCGAGEGGMLRLLLTVANILSCATCHVPCSMCQLHLQGL